MARSSTGWNMSAMSNTVQEKTSRAEEQGDGGAYAAAEHGVIGLTQSATLRFARTSASMPFPKHH